MQCESIKFWSSTTYYVQASSTGGTNYAGPSDNSFGGGGYYATGNRHLVFDALTDFTIKYCMPISFSLCVRSVVGICHAMKMKEGRREKRKK